MTWDGRKLSEFYFHHRFYLELDSFTEHFAPLISLLNIALFVPIPQF